ncbi:selenide, water dikinase [Xenorhabdus eapokensis]|uniref:Selenide, water dikinase n=1 Tax=Xenorhabdus eapokensis TaxID=1873482 RepID=A0A1Q5TSN6_9GAMM|nr:selenide, water dikinase [Xenorhabdus eapokensis]
MCQLNKAGTGFAEIDGVTAMTDVTGFDLLGHLSEICEGSGVQAKVKFSQIPRLPDVDIEKGCVPGDTGRNFDSYGHLVGKMAPHQCHLLCDPQTSGGLLLAILPDAVEEAKAVARSHDIDFFAIGELTEPSSDRALIEVFE